MTQPLITVGIPFYNSEHTILDAIRSIFAQTLQDWELILVDDGSTDRSLKIAQSLDDGRVRVYSDGTNQRLSARLNQITDLARGKYIARMDADDLCSPRRLEYQVKLLQEYPELDLAGTGIAYIDEDDTIQGDMEFPTFHQQICSKPYRKIGLCHASIVAKTSWYRQNRYDEQVLFAEDWNLWLRSYETSTFGNIAEPLYFYRSEHAYTLKKQMICRMVSSKFLFRHYWRKRQPLRASYYAALPLVKLAVVTAMCTLKLKRKILKHRYKPVNDKTKQRYEEEIQQVKNTKLPLKG